MKWIKTSDQLPPEQTKVLALYARGSDGVEIVSMYWSKEMGWYNFQFEPIRSLITYWSEMPEVPERWFE